MLVIENLERILASGQDNAKLRFGLASAYYKRRDYEEAVSQAEKALDLDEGDDPRTWRVLGRSLKNLGKTEEATEALRKGLDSAREAGENALAKEMENILGRMEKEGERASA